MNSTKLLNVYGMNGLTATTSVMYQAETGWSLEHVGSWISLALSCIVALVTIVYTVYCFYRKIKEKKEITKEEYEDLVKKIQDVQNKLPKIK